METIPKHADADEGKPQATEKRARRKAREVSSRYLMIPPTSPSPSSSAIPAGDAHFAPSPKNGANNNPPHLPLPVYKPYGHQVKGSSCFADENHQPLPPASTPLPSGIQNKIAVSTQRRRAVRLFSDNAGDQQQQQQNHDQLKMMDSKAQARKTRPGTPMVHAVDRNNTPRFNLLSQRSMNGRRVAVAQGSKSEPHTPARVSACTLDDDICSGSLSTSPENSVQSEADACSVSSMGGFCESPPIPASKVRPVSELRSSMPEADLLPTMLARRKDGNEDDICHRSLNSALSSCQQVPFSVSKSVSKPLVSSRLSSSMVKNFGPCLPPQPPNSKLGLELKKPKKVSSRQEDVHSLRLLHNQQLQWRFLNAKANTAVRARCAAAEKSFYNVVSKISELQDSVAAKKIELEELKRMRNLSTILETQMPILDDWAILEEDSSMSLSGAIEALQDAALRLPIIGNVKADIKELEEVLASATNMLEAITPSLGSFQPKAQRMENVISDLAGVVVRERALVQECGDLLSQVHRLQVNECSLRSQLVQLKQKRC